MINFDINQKIGRKISKEWVRKIIQRVLRETKKRIKGEISIAVVDNQTIKQLNKFYRGKDRVTDVLSFEHQTPELLGEIVICYPQAARQAKQHGHAVKKEIKILLVHGLLHLLGYDHESRKDAVKMERMMDAIL